MVGIEVEKNEMVRGLTLVYVGLTSGC